MYPVLILRTELVCLILLIFLLYTSKYYKVYEESTPFRRILLFGILHVVFDIITVITVNNMDTVPTWVNWICHMFFYLSALFFSNEIANYVVSICYPARAKKMYKIGHALIAALVVVLPFLKLTYEKALGTYSSAGTSAIVGYGLAFSFFIYALVLIFTHMDKMSSSIRVTLIPMLLVLMVTEVTQVFRKDLLFTGGAVTIVTVGFFFSMENPVEVFKKKALTDALTGVRSRSSYEEDIANLDKKFKDKPSEDYIFVFCDINDLRSVNNHFGHMEGDNYISLIASSINSCMKHCSTVYRIGGDEFLISYYHTDSSVVDEELRDFKKACKKISETLPYEAAASVGYAQSSSAFESLLDVVKTADYAMYQNKSNMKSGKLDSQDSLGTHLNYAGLTDKVFDAICASNERNYPFITNLETNVTRISPAWKEFFGLESEFYFDFVSTWKDRIHPDDFGGYVADVVATLNGHQKYHNYNYQAKKANGEYVMVSCHGSVYKDAATGTAYFSGFIENYGMDANTDPVTGLENFNILVSIVSSDMDQKKPFSIIKLKIKNLARINMLYGYSGGNEILKQLGSALSERFNNKGKVFCQGAVNFSLIFDSTDKEEIESYYQDIVDICAKGFELEAGIVPLEIAAGALINKGVHQNIEKVRSNLVFAVEESQYNQRNNLVFCSETKEDATDSDISLLANIHADALTEMKYFVLKYQPIIDLASKKTVGAETLLRWNNPKYGEVMPDRFIPFIESDPCYYRLGLWIIAMAIRDTKAIRSADPNFRINVNITALQLQNDRFLGDVLHILRKNNYPADGLVLELTERCKELNGDFLSKKVAAFRNEGIKVAFDDLGTGYSTISLLMNVPVDEIKLDKDFVQALETKGNYQLFVKALVAGRNINGYNYTICFEGIEDEQTLGLVSQYGNFLAQGYYFARPLPLEDFLKYINS